MSRYTVARFNRDFPNDDACLDYLTRLIYGPGRRIPCRNCERITKHQRVPGRKAYACKDRGLHMRPLAGTVLERTRLPLKVWLFAIYLVRSTERTSTAQELSVELGVTSRTAANMLRHLCEISL